MRPLKPLRTLRKLLKIALLALGALALVLAVAAFWLVRRSWPQVEGEVSVPGLAAPVEVVRDRWGVPHLFAADERDLFLAQGYVHAQDRFWQMEFNRRVASGTLAAALGPPLVETDRYLRTMGLRRAAERDLARLDARSREMLQAYADGVNRFLESGRPPLELVVLGIEPEPWTPVDSLAWARLMGLNLSLNQSFEVLRARLAAKLGPQAAAQLLPPYPPDAPVIVPSAAPARPPERQLANLSPLARGAHPFWGSNNWIVHGRRTATGRPLFANDTHLGLAHPSIWYANGLHGGGFDAVGFSFPGMPLVVLGHNRRIAWGITNMCTDVQDLYTETLDNRERPTRYLFRGAWRTLRRVRETIPVKGGDPVVFDVLSTHHGTLIDRAVPELRGGPPTALRWSALDGGSLMGALRGVNLAGSWQELRRALRGWDSPSVNLGYADMDGNIGYQSTGLIPIRPAGDRGVAPVPGADGGHEWQGYIPFDELPSALNPAEGFLVTANNKVAGDAYPHFLAHDFADPYRARRIRERLEGMGKATAEDMRLLQADTGSIPARELRPWLLRAQPANDLERRALEEVRRWDLRLDAGSPGAAVFEVWLSHLWDHVFADELGEELMASYRQLGVSQLPMVVALMEFPDSPWFDDRGTPRKETRDDAVRGAFVRAVAWLRERHGDDPREWRWGALHTVTFAHTPLGQSGIALLDSLVNSDALPVGGDAFTVNQAMYDPERPYAVSLGSSQRLIVDLADLDATLAVNSTGQSGHLFHAHRNDEIPRWLKVDLHPLPFTRHAVDRHAESRLVLRP